MSQYNLDLISHELGRETIYQRSIDGYVNATAMCQAADKKFNDYRRLQNTKEFVNESFRPLREFPQRTLSK